MEKEQVNFHPLTFFALAISQLPGYLIENCFIAYEHDLLIDWCTNFAKFVYEQTDKVLVYKDNVLDGDDTVEKYILEAEKLLTLAINSYEDNVKVTKTVTENGAKVNKEVVNDGPKKLAARRKIMAFVYDMPEERREKESLEAYRARTEGINHPIVEKIFNVYAPKYADRAKELGNFGGYTRVIKTSTRRGDASELAIVELV